MALTLHGYRHSIYTRIVRIVLAEKDVAADHVEVDPFAETARADLPHPFARVPVLHHDGIRLYETRVITAYLDEALDGPRLQPADAAGRARMNLLVAILDAYGYWPMVRQVYAARVFAPAAGQAVDPDAVTQGLTASRPVLDALAETLDPAGPWALGRRFTLADAHMAPMLEAFDLAPEGRELIDGHVRLRRWLTHAGRRESVVATRLALPDAGAP